MKSKLLLISIDFTYFLKLNTIYTLKFKKKLTIESNFMSEKFNKIYEQSIKNPESFWQEASNDIFWFKKPSKILNKSNPPFYKWFEDGVTNTCYNALDIHIDRCNLFNSISLFVSTKIHILDERYVFSGRGK